MISRKVVAVIGREPSTEEIAETPAEALGLYLSKLLDLTKACADAKIAAAKLKEVGEKLAPSIALPVVKDALTFAERVSRTADQWGEIPTVESDVFSPDSAAQPSPGLVPREARRSGRAMRPMWSRTLGCSQNQIPKPAYARPLATRIRPPAYSSSTRSSASTVILGAIRRASN